jgi:hypothetical protein
MRTDTNNFIDKNEANIKTPRYTIVVSFDFENTDLWYFTSHSDSATPTGVESVTTAGIVKNISGTSQSINPEEARSTIGSINFSLGDIANTIRDTLNTKIITGKALKGKRVQIYVGYEDLLWADYSLVQTQIIDDITYLDGIYTFRCSDIQREIRKNIFDVTSTHIISDVTDSAATISVIDTTDFTMVAHGTSYSDAPSSTVGYIRIDDEMIRYTGKTVDSFTGCTRGALGTIATEHLTDSSAAADKQPSVDEIVYLEMPAVKLALALLTGDLYNQGSETLPDSWHLGIDAAFVNESEFTGAGDDWWVITDDTKGINVRFVGLEKTDGKEFIETELMMLLGAYMPIRNNGAIGLKRMTNVLSDASYIRKLDEKNIRKAGKLTHAMKDVLNNLEIRWNYDPLLEKYTRKNILIAADSVNIYGLSKPRTLTFRGLHGSIHTSTTIAKRFDGLRDRYAGPPLRITAQAKHATNALEVGDVVKLKLENTQDFHVGGSIDRSFEIQNVKIDWQTGKTSFALFGSSLQADAISHTTAATVIADAWYISEGTELSTVLTIVADAVTVNGNLTAGIYYYDGDLTINAGVDVTFNGQVDLRIKGNLTINGSLDGKGRGQTGATAPDLSSFVDTTYSFGPHWHDMNLGTSGFLGNTIPASGLTANANTAGGDTVYEAGGDNGAAIGLVEGQHSSIPVFDLLWDGLDLQGTPSDMKGTSGSSGHASMVYSGTGVAGLFTYRYINAGNGGESGAGLTIVCRGLSFGVAGHIDSSGNDGTEGVLGNYGFLFWDYYAGSGAGGAPGGILIALDGNSATFPTISTSTIIAKYGDTPIPQGSKLVEGYPWIGGLYVTAPGNYRSSFWGTDDPGPDMSALGQAVRVQYVLEEGTPDDDTGTGEVAAPTGLVLTSGNATVLVQQDGTIVPRILTSFTASTDVRVTGYEIQYKVSTDSTYQSIAPLIGRDQTSVYISPVTDGITYDVRVRAATPFGVYSAWVTDSHTATGKTAEPSDVEGFSASQNGDVIVFQWQGVTDPDLSNYEIRYGPIDSTWENANPLITAGSGTNITTAASQPGTWDFFIKAIDTSGNESLNATSYRLTITTDNIVLFGTDEAPDWNGTLYKFVKHWTGVLVPSDQNKASFYTNFENFSGIPNPEPVCEYYSNEFDVDFEDDIRIWGPIESELMPGETGIADPKLYIDHRLTPVTITGDITWASSKAVYLDSGASAVDGFYDDRELKISAGTGNGQRRQVTTYQVESVTNDFIYSRDLSNAVWTNFNVLGIAQNETGIYGEANTAWTLTDNSASDEGIGRDDFTIPNDSNRHYVGIAIKKDTDQTRFPAITMLMTGGTSVVPTAPVMINTETGDFIFTDTAPPDYGVIDADDWWILYTSADNNSTGNTTLWGVVWPAYGTVWGTFSGAAQGSCIVDIFQLRLNATSIGKLVPTVATAVTETTKKLNLLTEFDTIPDPTSDYEILYDGFELWNIGTATARYVKEKLRLITSEGIAKITSFIPTIDRQQRTETKTGVVIAATTGTVITFDLAFHSIPVVTASPEGSTPLIPTITNVTTTGFTAHVFDTGGTDVGGTITYVATGT